MSDLNLYKWSCYCGRHGEVDGVFLAREEDVAKVRDRTIYFGEILGKHSEVEITFDDDDLQPVSDVSDSDIECLIRLLSNPKYRDGKWITLSGYNPLDYMDDEEEDA